MKRGDYSLDKAKRTYESAAICGAIQGIFVLVAYPFLTRLNNLGG